MKLVRNSWASWFSYFHLIIIHPRFSPLIFRILLGKLRISGHAGRLGDVILPPCLSRPVTSAIEAIVSRGPDPSHGPQALPDHPLGDEGPAETHGRSQSSLHSIPWGLTRGIKYYLDHQLQLCTSVYICISTTQYRKLLIT